MRDRRERLDSYPHVDGEVRVCLPQGLRVLALLIHQAAAQPEDLYEQGRLRVILLAMILRGPTSA